MPGHSRYSVYVDAINQRNQLMILFASVAWLFLLVLYGLFRFRGLAHYEKYAGWISAVFYYVSLAVWFIAVISRLESF